MKIWSNLGFRGKMTISMIGLSISSALIFVAIMTITVSGITKTALERELGVLYDDLKGSIDAEAHRARAMAEVVAANTDVRSAFAAGDREALSRMYVQDFPALKKTTGVRQFQFHVPPATSFLRVHKPEKFGDDLSSFRKTVLQTNQKRAPLTGLEKGVAGIGIRGVVPVSTEAGHVGSVEFGLSLGDDFIKKFAEKPGFEVLLYVFNEQNQLELFAASTEEVPLDGAILNAALTNTQIYPDFPYGERAHGMLAGSIADFSGKNIGVAVLLLDSGHYTDLRASANWASLIAFVVILLLASAGVLVMYKSSAAPLIALTDVIVNVANGDVTGEDIYQDRQDEIGKIASAVGVLRKGQIKSQKMAIEISDREKKDQEEKDQRLKQAAEQERAEQEAKEEDRLKQEAARREMMSDMADNFEKSVQGIIDMVVETSSQLSERAKNLSALSADGMSKAEYGNKAVEQTSDNMATVASSTEEMASSVSEITRQVSQSSHSAQEAVAKGSAAQDQITNLSEKVTSIDSVLALISDISDQTNLLALNATIEAARAGEAGRGFAVVASEVKALANQTANAANDIQKQVEDMQLSTKDAVEQISSVITNVNDFGDMITNIAAAVEEQDSATKEIARSARMASDNSGEVSINIAGLTETVDETGAVSSSLSDEVRDLDSHVQTLQDSTAKFLQQVRQGG